MFLFNILFFYLFCICDLGLRISAADEIDVGFHLYTKASPDQPEFLETNDLKSFTDSKFNPNNQIKIVIHGFSENFTRPESSSQIVLKGFLCNGGDFNIILIDYNTTVDGLLTDYVVLHDTGIPVKVAAKITEFIEYIKKSFPEITNKKIDLIGFSLGGQISALTAQKIDGKLNSITALDPAAPLYTDKSDEHKLSVDDAEYVETIHTSSLSGMFFETHGESDIFVNSGIPQPGCLLMDVPCNHIYSAKLFARTLCDKEPLVAHQCSKFRVALGFCKERAKPEQLIVGGNPLEKKSGVYSLQLPN